MLRRWGHSSPPLKGLRVMGLVRRSLQMEQPPCSHYRWLGGLMC